MSVLREPKDRIYFTVLLLLTLAVAGWFVSRWLERHRQEEQLFTFTDPPAGKIVTGFAPPEMAVARFLRYGEVAYDSVPVRYSPPPYEGVATMEAWGYQPRAMPWLADRDQLGGRWPAIEVNVYQFAGDSEASTFADALFPPGFDVIHRDPRGVVWMARQETVAREFNVLAWLASDSHAYVFTTVDDRFGMQAVIDAGFSYRDDTAVTP